MIRFSYLVFVLLLLSGKSDAQGPYVNPVIGNPQRVEHETADPVVLKWFLAMRRRMISICSSSKRQTALTTFRGSAEEHARG
jgi:hypothetical protein